MAKAGFDMEDDGVKFYGLYVCQKPGIEEQEQWWKNSSSLESRFHVNPYEEKDFWGSTWSRSKDWFIEWYMLEASLDRRYTTGRLSIPWCRINIMAVANEIDCVANSTTKAEYVAASSCWNTVRCPSRKAKKIIITESSVRRDIQLADEEGVDWLPNSTIFEQLTLMGSKTTAWNKVSSTMASAIICLATNWKFNFSKFIFDSMIRNLDNLSGFLNLEKTKTTQHNEIASLKRRAKKLKKKDRSRTHRLKRLYKVGLTTRVESSYNKESLGEDASKQGSIDAIDADEEITLVSVQNIDEEMFDVNVLDGEEVFVAEQEVAANKENNEVNVIEEVVKVINTAKSITDAAQVSAATTTTVTITIIDDITDVLSLHGYAVSSLMDTAYWSSK
ncbi:hypothetical protein Tco_1156873 [Tanacetum coccineum]